MPSALTVSLLQSVLHWEAPEQNREMFAQKINQLPKTDLVVLPEMFNTGFSMNSEKLAEPPEGETFEWMKAQAAQKDAAVVGSVITKEKNLFFNRLYWVNPDGSFYTYDKRHLFRMAGEHHHFSPGTKRLVLEYKGWKIMPLVCYDLRFPVWSRNQNKVNAARTQNKPEFDLQLFVANWPAPRANAWSSLLVARAIENQCYVIGVNRVGEDGKEIPYSGHSALINPKGEVVGNFNPNEEGAFTQTIDLEELNDFREKFPVGLDSDRFNLT